QYVEGNLLCGREFQDLEDLRACARWWMLEKSDLHLHETTGRPPLELFLEQEQAALTPLPVHPYDSAEVGLRVCNLDGYIDYETNRYPVPYEHVTDILTMKVTEHEVMIYSPIRYGLEPVQVQFMELGEHSEEFLRGLKNSQPKNSGFHARYILHLKERYNCDDINSALGHACRYHAFDC
ncbi:hypothetical protein JZU56_04015, partial [bacterium]|nr:hypothetical protein [bacterium]